MKKAFILLLITALSLNLCIGLAYMVVLNLYAEGGMYGIVSGNKPDNIHVDFVDEQTGNVFDQSDSKNMEE